TAIIEGQNFFGRPLGPGDSSYDASQFTTKIAGAGVWFAGYNEDGERLANTPRVYLLPAGQDVLRPRNTQGEVRLWNVVEQMLPVPYRLGPAELQSRDWNPRRDGLSAPLFAVKPHARLRAYPYDPAFDPSEMNTDSQLIGRSVWNTQWLLVIPGSTLLADPQTGIETFMADVQDIYIYFQTYAYTGE
ncbi:MAG: hypothetical protein KDE58_35180, partial [Caldilineaceae bacterium]|nr:hypothetical protein [Caldilineaceae bacterium]